MAKKKSPKKKTKGANSLENYKLERKKKKRKLTKKITISSVIILLLILGALVFLILVMQGLIENPFQGIGRESQTIRIPDRCSLIAGQLIHTIKDEGICEIMCKSNCELQELDYESVEFTQNTNDCNTCNCNCG